MKRQETDENVSIQLYFVCRGSNNVKMCVCVYGCVAVVCTHFVFRTLIVVDRLSSFFLPPFSLFRTNDIYFDSSAH